MNINGVQTLQDYHFSNAAKPTRAVNGPSLPGDDPSQATEAPKKPVITVDASQHVKLPGEIDPRQFLTPEGFKSAVETQNLDYDLNNNGVVNIDDLLELLSSFGPAQGADDADAPADAAPQRESVVNTLLADYAADVITLDPPVDDAIDDIAPSRTDGSEFVSTILDEIAQNDDNDGPVLSDVGKTSTVPEVTPFASTLVNDTSLSQGATLDNISQEIYNRLSTAGFLGAPEGLGEFISLGTTADDNAVRTIVGSVEELFAQQSENISQKQAEWAAQRLFTNLEEAGYTKNPPVNVHELVAKLTENTGKGDSVLSALSKFYPDGLGIDIRG